MVTHLERLSINNCKLGDAGGIAIGEAISRSYRLKYVSAKQNAFRDEAAKSIADGIRVGTHILKLDLSNNLINDAGGELIAESL